MSKRLAFTLTIFIIGLMAVLAIVRSPASAKPGETPVAPTAETYVQVAPVDLTANDLIYDPGRGVVWASVPSSGGSRGNGVTAIGPDGALGQNIFVGSEPNKLALSDDGQYLYVGLDGAGAVRRVDLNAGAAGLEWSLGSNVCGRWTVSDMVTLAGNGHAVAVSRRNSGCSPSHEGVAVYDDGVMRPDTTPGHTGSNVIERSAAAGTLYGLNNESTEWGFRVMTVSQTGITTTTTIPNLFTGFGQLDMRYSDGRLYATTGEVVDAGTLTLTGTYSAQGLVVPNAATRRVYFVAFPFSELPRLWAFDMDTFLPLFDLGVPDLAQNSDPGRGFVAAGEDQFGFIRADQKVYLLSLYEGYDVSGKVVLPGGMGLPGAVVSDGAGHSAVTDWEGNYSLGVPAGSYTLTVSLDGYTFDPPARAITVPPAAGEQNFVGRPPTYTIIGRVVDEAGQPVSGVVIYGEPGNSTLTGANGFFSFTGLLAGYYEVTPFREGYEFTPPRHGLTLPSNVPAIDFVMSPLRPWKHYMPVVR